MRAAMMLLLMLPSGMLLAGDLVIPAGEVVEIQSGDYDTVTVEGTWKAKRGESTSITVDLIFIDGGTLDLGTPESPLCCPFSVVVKDTPPVATPHLGEEGGTGIVAEHGGTILMHGVEKQRYHASPEPLLKGQTEFVLPEGHNWQVGDRVWIPTLRQQDSWNVRGNPGYHVWHQEYNPDDPRNAKTVPSEDRVYVIEAITCGVVRLNRGIREDVPIIPGVLNPLVVNLSRNIVIQSANPDGFRGHIAAAGPESGIDMRWVEVRNMGRTRGLLDEYGEAVPSTIGRYPIHMHHLKDSTTPRHIEGCVVYGGRKTKWGLVVHQTHYAQILRNTVVSLHGAGIVCEDQNETGCLFAENVVGDITAEHSETPKGMPKDADPTNPLRGFEGAGFWATGYSEFKDNIAVNCEHGYELPAAQFRNLANQIFGKGEFFIPTATFEGCTAAACEEGFEFWRADEVGTTDLVGCRIGNCRIAVDPTKESVKLTDCTVIADPADDGENGRGWQKNNGIIGVETNSAYTGRVELTNTRMDGLQCALFSARNFYFTDTVIRSQRGFHLGVRGNPELQWQTKTPPTAAPRFHNFPEVSCTHGNYIIEPSDEYPNAVNESLPWMAYDESTKTWAFGGIDE